MLGCQATGMEKRESVWVGVVCGAHLRAPRSPVSLLHLVPNICFNRDLVHVGSARYERFPAIFQQDFWIHSRLLDLPQAHSDVF